MFVVEDIGSDGFSKDVKMPMIHALDIEKYFEKIGAKLKEKKVYTSGPRTMFKFSLTLEEHINTFSKLVVNTSISGEFVTSTTTGRIDVSVEGKVVTKYPYGGFMTSCLVDYYNRYLYMNVLENCRKQFERICGEVNAAQSNDSSKLEKK